MALDTRDLPVGLDDAAAFPPALVRRELDRITSSKVFQSSRRHQKLLRHLVERAVTGQAAALKEPLLALEVFDRPIDAFDPTRDTIVRVEARRLLVRSPRAGRPQRRGCDEPEERGARKRKHDLVPRS